MTVAPAPNFENERTETDDTKVASPITLKHSIHRITIMPPIDKPEPHFTCARIDKDEPMLMKSATDIKLPNLANCLTLNVEERLPWSNSEAC
jgi:hypothetical protein